MARYTHAIKIEGLGDVSASTATDKRYRYCYGRALFDDIASADPDDLFGVGVAGVERDPDKLDDAPCERVKRREELYV